MVLDQMIEIYPYSVSPVVNAVREVKPTKSNIIFINCSHYVEECSASKHHKTRININIEIRAGLMSNVNPLPLSQNQDVNTFKENI